MSNCLETGLPRFRVRFAEEKDCGLILSFIQALAAYEKLEDQVVATEDSLRESIFGKKQAEVLIGEEDGNPVGFALFFCNYSTFLGKGNLYLEDLFVQQEHRGKGYGAALFKCLGAIAVERDYGRFDWACLDWNESSIAFYKKMGAVPLDEWTVYRLEGDGLKALADR